MTSIFVIPSKLSRTWVGACDEGMRLELSCDVSGKPHHFATLLADEGTEELFLQLTVGGKVVHILVTDIEAALAAARAEVPSETWFDSRGSAKGSRADDTTS